MSDLQLTTSWNLEKYFYTGLDDPRLKIDMEAILPACKDFAEKYKGRVRAFEAADFLEFFKAETELDKLTNKPAEFLFFLKSVDSQNQEVLKKNGELEHVYIEASNLLTFVSQEIKEIGYEKLMWFSHQPELQDYENYFVQSALRVKYILDETTEKALNLKSTSGASAFNDLYEEYTGSFEFEIEENGQKKKLTEDDVRTMRQSPDGQKRVLAWGLLRQRYNNPETRIVISNVYRSVVKSWVSEIKIRGYGSPISIRNVGEEQEDQTIQILLDSISSGYGLCQRYIRLKSKLMEVEKLKGVDLFAPLSPVEQKYGYEQGVVILMDVLKSFDADFYGYAEDLLTQGRIDVFPKKGKRGGAFAAYEDNMESFILLNYTEDIRDVMTLSHEMGHAIHGHLRQVQASQVQSEPLSLSETASIFLENLVARELFKKIETNEDKINFLESYIGDITSTVFRQIQYILFEVKAHEAVLNGQELSYEDLNKLWRETQIQMYGDTLEFDVLAEQESGWSGIPHIFRTPFYCYTYSFGNLLAFSLLARYEAEGQAFVPKYKQILKSGGSKPPLKLLKEVGIDINSTTFYTDGLKVYESLVEELEELVG
jgi:oligoendopeptidase F